jgi:ApaG protein
MKNNIKVEAHVTFLEAQSSQYAFAYTITITNKGDIGAQLLTRFWQIKDESGDMEEVVGEGVIGMQPHIAPGESFQYSSGAVIKTLTGSMYGSYGMINDDGDRFDAEIPEFILTKPYTLH